MLMGLLRPTCGDIRVLGLDVFRVPGRVKQRVGYVPETPYIGEPGVKLGFFCFLTTEKTKNPSLTPPLPR
jgi:hypothetical protein